MIYRIANWDASFETYETKKLAHLKWVPVPNKHDGLGFRRVASQKNRCELFAAWNLILQVASKGRKDVERGMLIRDGRPLTSEDLAMMTGFPHTIFESAIKFFSSKEMGWLVVDTKAVVDGAGKTAEPPVKTAEPPAEGKEGIEGKEVKAMALLLLSYLNEKAGRNFEECSANMDFIQSRLSDCDGDVAGCKQMIDRQCALWKGDAKMEEFLRPSTLFNATKFRSYYDDRSRPVVRGNGKPQQQQFKPHIVGSGNY